MLRRQAITRLLSAALVGVTVLYSAQPHTLPSLDGYPLLSPMEGGGYIGCDRNPKAALCPDTAPRAPLVEGGYGIEDFCWDWENPVPF